MNMTVKKIQLTIAKRTGEISQCGLDYQKNDPPLIVFRSSIYGKKTFSGGDLFDSLNLLREYLEEDNWFLLCNGSRLNAYPSRMSRQMSGGKKLYLLTMGKQARRDDLVDMFEQACIKDVATTSEQRLFYSRWLKSL